jgi:hypothetical protein
VDVTQAPQRIYHTINVVSCVASQAKRVSFSRYCVLRPQGVSCAPANLPTRVFTRTATSKHHGRGSYGNKVELSLVKMNDLLSCKLCSCITSQDMKDSETLRKLTFARSHCELGRVAWRSLFHDAWVKSDPSTFSPHKWQSTRSPVQVSS